VVTNFLLKKIMMRSVMQNMALTIPKNQPRPSDVPPGTCTFIPHNPDTRVRGARIAARIVIRFIKSSVLEDAWAISI